jgi:superfamily II DNA/RNA helicase
MGEQEAGARRTVDTLLAHAGVEELYPFQLELRRAAAAAPDRDVLLEAPTGAGKTLAFAAVAFDDLARLHPPVGPPAVLVITPTRELAQQGDRVLRPLARGVDRRSALLQGGVAFDPQLRNLDRGADLVVGTPGRLLDMARRGQLALGGIVVAIVDEADRLGDLGFLDDVAEILRFVPLSARRVLVSATLSGAVDELARELRPGPIEVRTALAPANAPEGLGWGSHGSPHLRVTIVRERLRADLGRLLDASTRSLVFVRSRHAAVRWAGWINEDGRRAVVLHGGLSTAARRQAIEAFRLGDEPVLVATDLAARGLDIPGVALVAHVEHSDDERDYVHRSGRTGRAGLPGVVVNLIRQEQRRAVVAMEERLGVIATDVTLGEAVGVIDEVVPAIARALGRASAWTPPLGRRTSGPS